MEDGVWGQVGDILRCPICFDMLEDARFLPCGHTFCQRCIEMCQRHFVGLNCPTCRQNTTTVSIARMRAGLGDLPRNLIAQDMAQVARNVNEVGDDAAEEREAVEGGREGNNNAEQEEAQRNPVPPVPQVPPLRGIQRRPRRNILSVICGWFATILFWIVFGIFVIIAGAYVQFYWASERDKLSMVTIASELCNDVVNHLAGPKQVEEELHWLTKMKLFYQKVFYPVKEDEKPKPTTWEQLKAYLTETSRGICESVEEDRRRRYESFLSG